jgi:hypothetical protein
MLFHLSLTLLFDCLSVRPSLLFDCLSVRPSVCLSIFLSPYRLWTGFVL